MATKIIYTNERAFKPVKIELEFTTRQQLAVFIQVMRNAEAVAEALEGNCPLTKQAELMGESSMRDAINELINHEVVNDLIELANA